MNTYCCKKCNDVRWICEKHLGPWEGNDYDCGVPGGCAGPGMPCECSPLHHSKADKERMKHGRAKARKD